MKRIWFVTTAVLMTMACLGAAPAEYKVDVSHSSVAFSVRHMMVTNVKGEFTDFEATAMYDPENLSQSSVSATIKTASIDTANERRDDHLRNADFFEVEKYPEMLFKSTQIRKSGGTLYIDGDLTMHGVTKPVTLTVEEGPTPPIRDPWGNERIGLVATATLNRTDFGLNWNQALEAGGILVGEEVKVTLDLSLIRQAE